MPSKPMIIRTVLITMASLVLSLGAQADPYNIGYKKCQKCHEAEVDVYKKTDHFKSYKKIHKSKDAKKILKAVGGAKSMKKSKVCATCHYTAIRKSAKKKAKIKNGPTCESCHGPASDWKDIHNDYGDAEEAKDETPAHKKQRIEESTAAGMIWPSKKFDVAMNCMGCHGLARPGIDGETLATMLDAGHPIEPDFELVAYSQGSVRHRFYPPNVDDNAEMTPAETANLFAVGQVAKLLSATQATAKSSHPKYQQAQKKRVDDAARALAAISSIAEVKAFTASPDEASARAAVKAIMGKDLSAKLGSLLPAKSDYK